FLLPSAALRHLLCSSLVTLRPPTSTLFPYTTLFRSHRVLHHQRVHLHRHAQPQADHDHRRGEMPLRVAVLEAGEHPVAEHQHDRSEEHTSELQSRFDLVCRLLLEKKNNKKQPTTNTR